MKASPHEWFLSTLSQHCLIAHCGPALESDLTVINTHGRAGSIVPIVCPIRHSKQIEASENHRSLTLLDNTADTAEPAVAATADTMQRT